jgi:N-acetylmuramic acid 6-phosphate etherase
VGFTSGLPSAPHGALIRNPPDCHRSGSGAATPREDTMSESDRSAPRAANPGVVDLDGLTTEARNPRSDRLDRLDTLDMVRLINAEDATVAAAVGRTAPDIARAIDVIAERMARGGRLVYAGAGTSGRLGVLDAAECPPTFNTKPGQVVGLIAGGAAALTTAVEGAEDDAADGAAMLRGIAPTADDVVVGITASGRAPWVLGVLDEARRAGAFTIGFACNAEAALRAHADLCILPVVGPEVLAGSTRLKAGTATKMVLNMLTTGAMVRLGKTWGNLMVDVQATNEKLVERAVRMVQTITGRDRESARTALEACGGAVKPAVVTLRLGVGPDEARERLHRAQGRLAAVLDDAENSA